MREYWGVRVQQQHRGGIGSGRGGVVDMSWGKKQRLEQQGRPMGRGEKGKGAEELEEERDYFEPFDS